MDSGLPALRHPGMTGVNQASETQHQGLIHPAKKEIYHGPPREKLIAIKLKSLNLRMIT